jgi:hypothetical protein
MRLMNDVTLCYNGILPVHYVRTGRMNLAIVIIEWKIFVLMNEPENANNTRSCESEYLHVCFA